MDKTIISEKFKLRGFWWLPLKEKDKIPGTLSYDPEGLMELDLDGTFWPETPINNNAYRYLPLLYGKTHDGKCCTLIDVYEVFSNLNYSHGYCINITRVIFNQLYIGDGYVNPDLTLYKAALIEFMDLGAWMHRDPFSYQQLKEDSKESIMYCKPPLISVDVESIKANISINPDITHTRYDKSYTCTYKEIIRITPYSSQNIEWNLKVLFNLQKLFSLLIGRPIYIIRIQLLLFIDNEIKSKSQENNFSSLVDLCFNQTAKREKRELLPPQIPFTYPCLSNNWEIILNNWFEKSISLETVTALNFGLSINRDLPVDFKFLAVIQAIESFHRINGKNLYMSNEDYEPIREILKKAIPESLSSAHRDAIKNRINYGNEYSLQKRLKLILENIPDPIVYLITNNDKNYFCRIVDTRNYLVHRDESLKSKVLDNKEMFNVSEKLKLIIEFLLLREIGLTDDTLKDIMTKHRSYQNRQIIL